MPRKMRDSGVEWIGAIPEGWECCRLKFIAECLDGRRIPIDKALRVSGPYPYWGAGSIQDYVVDHAKPFLPTNIFNKHETKF